MPPTAPMGDLWREYERIRPEIDQAIERVLRRDWFVLGQEVEAFEAEWAAHCGTALAVGAGNGTDAVHLALRAAGVGEGGELGRPVAPAEAEHVYHRYVVRTSLRDALRDYLDGAGVATSIHYPCRLHLQPAFAHLGYEPGSCPNTEALAAEVLSLPVFPHLTVSEAGKVIRLVRFFFAMH